MDLHANDLKALRHLFDSYYKELVRFSMKIVMNKEISEEIVQDVFIRIWNNRYTLKIEKSVNAYLIASVKNASINYLKSRHARIRFVRLEDSGDFQEYHSAEDYIITQELKKVIHEAVQALPPKCKIIFNLSRNAGLSNQDIANQLKISRKTVQTQIGIAIQRIKKALKNRWEDIPG